MCNAWNHDVGCTCGFGPPYAVSGKIILAGKKEWIDIVRSSKIAFQRSLEATGFDSETISENLALYGETIRKGEDLKDWLMRFIGRYYVTLGTEIRFIKIPLFKLHLPEKVNGVKVKGSKVTFKEETFTERNSNWSLRVFGTGMGATQNVKIVCSSEITAEKGKCKIVFVTIPIRVSKIALIKNNQPINYFIKAEVARSATFHNGAKSCNKKDCEKDTKLIGPPSDVYQLSEDTKGSISTYEKKWTYGTGRKVNIGIIAFKMKASMEIQINRKHELTLTFDLPDGHDYILLPLKNKGGIKWKTFDTHREAEQYLRQ
jgi:hypothetical protein